MFGLKITKLNAINEESPSDFPLPKINPFQWLTDYKIATIIDIGANIGQFADKVLDVLPNVQLHCFEPITDVYLLLKSKFEDRSNIHLYNFGLSDKNEQKKIFKNEYSPSSSLLEMLDLHKQNFDYAVKTEPESINLRILDEVFSTPLVKPLLIKIDVQGYELPVLRGAEKLIQDADIIITETSFYPLYKDQPLFEDIYNYLTPRGFKYGGNVEQLLAPGDQKILQADSVFINQRKK